VIKKPKILFCTVFYNEWYIDLDGNIHRNWNSLLPIEKSFDELSRLSYQQYKYYQPKTVYETDDFIFEWRRVRCTFIDEGRNACINLHKSQAIKQKLPEDYDYYWFIDSDTSFTYAHIIQLLNNTAPILSGAYAERANPKKNYCAGYFKSNFKGVISKWLTQNNKGIRKVDWHGMGFCKIHRSVFEKCKYEWFSVETVNFMNENGDPSTLKIHEDIYFCMNAKKHGYDLLVDCDCVVNHHLDQVVSVIDIKKILNSKPPK